MSGLRGRYGVYPQLTDSGQVWLGAIPNQWATLRNKYAASYAKGRNPKELHIDGGEGLVPYLSMRYLRGRSEAQYASVEPGCRLAAPDQVLVVWDGSNAGEFVRGKAGLLSSTMAMAAVSRVFHAGYYWFVCKALEPELRRTAVGMGIPHVDGGQLRCALLPLPPLEDQVQVAKFLEYEAAKIDALIEKQQQLIALLKEKRQAVISHAVTKGLNPDAPMRDSGVEWLGEVPAHWETRAISKCITKITNGYVGPTRDILVEEGVSYVQATHIKNGVVNFDGAYFVRDEWSAAHSKSILQEGDVLIVQTGAGTGDVGLVSQNENGFNCHALIILTSDTHAMTGAYLSLALQSEYGRAVLFSIRTGGMHPHLNCGEVKCVKVPTPPVDEQKAIAGQVRLQLVHFDSLEARALQAVELLQERRTALISAAVTGKIDVRGWKALKSQPKAVVA